MLLLARAKSYLMPAERAIRLNMAHPRSWCEGFHGCFAHDVDLGCLASHLFGRTKRHRWKPALSAASKALADLADLPKGNLAARTEESCSHDKLHRAHREPSTRFVVGVAVAREISIRIGC